MHQVALGERERPADKPPQPLAQDVVEPLDVAGLAVAFARCSVPLGRQHKRIRRPEICVQNTLTTVYTGQPKTV